MDARTQGLTGKVAMVTGASRGIGEAVARRLAQDGARVVVNYQYKQERAEALARQLGGIALQADMGNLAAVREMFRLVMEECGRLDVLVNNAGVARFGPMAELTDEDYEVSFAVNARGVFVAMQEAARRMENGGRIINISTGATVGGTAGGSVYCGSKAAVEQFTRALARELGPRGITVNTVSPGFTDTDMLNANPALVERAAGMAALGRIGTTADLADVVGWLASWEARWITGQNIQAGGGASMV